MIQKTSARMGSTGLSSPQLANDGPAHWGQWSGHRHYALEVVQHPLRARMCGFGDKDRRPLAPAAVAKMIVRREDNSIVDVDEVDCSFFLVTVDLWSADGSQEMNLVLHPSSAENRYASSHFKHKWRGSGASGGSTSHQRSEPQTPVPPHATPSSQHLIRPSGDPQSVGVTPAMQSPQGYPSQGYSFSQQQPATMSESLNFQPAAYAPPSSDPNGAWGYATGTMNRGAGFPAPVRPSIHSFGRNDSPVPGMATGEAWNSEVSTRGDTEIMAYHTWQADSSYPALENASGQTAFGNPPVDPSLRSVTSSHSSNSDVHESPWPAHPMHSSSESTHQHRYNQESFPAGGSQPQMDGSMYPASYSQHSPQTYYSGSYVQNTPSAPPPPPPPSSVPVLPRHTYTRTLVGPLSSNACRLLDEHRKPGIFFLFQDLSVRTEGTFRLRLRLMNVGAPPAPEPGALRVHTDMSPVLAQTFTETFVVFSAKRFPGVPDTTALSIAFGNQGQKLPLRNRHGSIKQGRRRQRGDSDGSDDDSDGG